MAVFMSDCSAVANFLKNGYAVNKSDASAKALNAGLDIYGGWGDKLWTDGFLHDAISTAASAATLATAQDAAAGSTAAASDRGSNSRRETRASSMSPRGALQRFHDKADYTGLFDPTCIDQKRQDMMGQLESLIDKSKPYTGVSRSKAGAGAKGKAKSKIGRPSKPPTQKEQAQASAGTCGTIGAGSASVDFSDAERREDAAGATADEPLPRRRRRQQPQDQHSLPAKIACDT